MAIVTKSIGAAKDYASLVAWEAASYGATGADNAIGELYGTVIEANDVVVNDTTPIDITLQSEATTERHDGTAGSGSKSVLNGTTALTFSPNGTPFTIQWMEFDGDGDNIRTLLSLTNTGGAGVNTCQNNIIHGIVPNRSGNSQLLLVVNGLHEVFNNVLYDATEIGTATVAGIRYIAGQTNLIYNNTIENIETSNAAGTANGIIVNDDADYTYKNNLVQNITATGGGSRADYSSTMSGLSSAAHNNNTSGDATGDTSFTSISVSFTDAGAGKLTLSADPSVDAEDLGAVANIDITGRDRDGEGDTWDVGASQFPAAVGGGLSIPIAMHHFKQQRI